MVTFEQLGICKQLTRICRLIGFEKATKIQTYVIPYAIKNRDIIGCSYTGSGKTLAFLLPILNELSIKHIKLKSLIILPSRELAFQIASYVESLGIIFGIKTIILSGGIKESFQIQLFETKPDIIVCTPGRLYDHLKKNKKL